MTDDRWLHRFATQTWLEIFAAAAVAVLVAVLVFAMLDCALHRHRPPNDWGR